VSNVENENRGLLLHGSRCHDLGKSLGHRAAIVRPSDVRLGTFNGFLMVQPGSKGGSGQSCGSLVDGPTGYQSLLSTLLSKFET
jgi:hypothetical protein